LGMMQAVGIWVHLGTLGLLTAMRMVAG
jgi:hypothetical protein